MMLVPDENTRSLPDALRAKSDLPALVRRRTFNRALRTVLGYFSLPTST